MQFPPGLEIAPRLKLILFVAGPLTVSIYSDCLSKCSELLSKEWKDYFWDFVDIWIQNEKDDAHLYSAKDCLKKILKHGHTILSEPLTSLFEFSLTLRAASPRLVLYRQLAEESLSSFPLVEEASEISESMDNKKSGHLLVGANTKTPGGKCCWVDTGGALFFDVSELQQWLHDPPQQ